MELNGGSRFAQTAAVGISLFIVFAGYYLVAARHLPVGAGPDEPIHLNVAHFIYQNHRLPVLPRDREQLMFTAYGTTRALRPPLSYIVSAAVAKLDPSADDRIWRSLRYGSALLCGAAVLFAFLALVIYFDSLWMGVVGAALIGLMPQYVFVASYNNDDSGAIFSVTLAVLSMVLLLRKGMTPWNLLLMGLSIGLIVLSKLTAWLALPFIGVFLLAHLARKKYVIPRALFVLAVTSVIGGGWWIFFNMHHYGVDDPLLFKITGQMIDQYARLPSVLDNGFAARGVGFKELLLTNHANFIGESFKAVVGNLDWLRLPVGALQYGLYLVVIVLAVAGFAWRLAAVGFNRIRADDTGQTHRDNFYFETLLFSLICFQGFMYTWTNVHNDIQIQGRYLIPVFLPMLILFCAALMSIGKAAVTVLENWFWPGVTRIQLNVLHMVGAVAVILIVAVHINALVSYVIPFYSPKPKNLNVQNFREWDMTEKIAITRKKDLDMTISDKGLELDIHGPNAWIMMPHGFCGLFGKRNSIIRVRMWADRAGIAQLYIDDGDSFREQLSFRAKFEAGENALVFAVGAERCHAVRFDPMNGAGSAVIHEISAAPLSIQDKRP